MSKNQVRSDTRRLMVAKGDKKKISKNNKCSGCQYPGSDNNANEIESDTIFHEIKVRLISSYQNLTLAAG